MKADWQYIGSCADGEKFMCEGVNLWEHKWHPIGGRAEVTDPHYYQKFSFEICEVIAGGKRIEFAAGEFSNCIWGFYQRKSVFPKS